MTFSDAVPTEAIERYLESEHIALGKWTEERRRTEEWLNKINEIRDSTRDRIRDYEAALESRRHGNG